MILVTGATGNVGSEVVKILTRFGLKNLRATTAKRSVKMKESLYERTA